MDKYTQVAQAKTNKKVWRLFIESILAGFFIAVGGYASQMAITLGFPKTISALIFPAGLIMVVLTGSELFTGNCLIIGPACKNLVKWDKAAKVLGVSYAGNLAGALIMVCMARVIASDSYIEIASQAANAKISMGVAELLVRAILCNILVCVAVWMAINTTETTGKILACAIPVFVFVFCGFEHSIANMYFLPIGAGANIALIFRQIAIVTIGNMVGGAVVGIALECR